MDQESVISDIERRAQRAGISIRSLCERADVHPTTFSRWKRTERNPAPMGASLLAIGRLYDALLSFEAQQRRATGKAVRA